MRGFDLGLMPLSPDPYASGKAAYKLLQYLALGVPAVASAAFFFGRRKFRANPSLTVTMSPVLPTLSMSSSSMTFTD